MLREGKEGDGKKKTKAEGKRKVGPSGTPLLHHLRFRRTCEDPSVKSTLKGESNVRLHLFTHGGDTKGEGAGPAPNSIYSTSVPVSWEGKGMAEKKEEREEGRRAFLH